MEKEKTAIKIMDADHRLPFEAASRIVDAYEKKSMEKERAACRVASCRGDKRKTDTLRLL